MENAVHRIQEALLESDPALKGGRFTIEVNKRITVAKTRHEVDVYVVTQPGTSYESIVIFECKDWKKPVSKNEIMNLKEKVEILGATRGVMVGHRLSKDAEELLKGYPRVRFLRCNHDIKSVLQVNALHIVHDPQRITVKVTPRDPTQTFPENLKECLFHWAGRTSMLQALAYERVEALASEDKTNERSKYQAEGSHWQHRSDLLQFGPGEFSLSGIEVAAVETEVTFSISVLKHSPAYVCCIDGEGNVASFEIKHPDFPGRKLDLDLVLAFAKKPLDAGPRGDGRSKSN